MDITEDRKAAVMAAVRAVTTVADHKAADTAAADRKVAATEAGITVTIARHKAAADRVDTVIDRSTLRVPHNLHRKGATADDITKKS